MHKSSSKNINPINLLVWIFFVIFCIFWIFIHINYREDHHYYQIFSATYGLMALIGGLIGLRISLKWGGFKSVLGKAFMFFSFGLFAQEFGQLSYSYYAYIIHGTIPYPSIGDIGYFGSIPLYIIATMHLAHACGVNVGLKSFSSKIQALIIPLIMLILSYILFLKGYFFDWTNPIVILLDFAYPMGQAIYVSMAILTYLLSRNILGGIMKKNVMYILLALIIQYISDYTFLYGVSRDLIYVGGPNDLLYFFSYFAMTCALLNFNKVYSSLKKR